MYNIYYLSLGILCPALSMSPPAQAGLYLPRSPPGSPSEISAGRRRSYISGLFAGVRLGRPGDEEPHSAHPAQGPEHGGHLQLRQVPQGRGRARGRDLGVGQGVLRSNNLKSLIE